MSIIFHDDEFGRTIWGVLGTGRLVFTSTDVHLVPIETLALRQVLHPFAPAISEYSRFFTSHLVHASSPSFGAYFPGSHFVHPDRLLWEPHRPAAHPGHEVLFAAAPAQVTQVFADAKP